MYVISLVTELDVVKDSFYLLHHHGKDGKVYVIDDAGDTFALHHGEYILFNNDIKLESTEPSYKEAYLEFHNRTEWVQETATTKEWGMHRADILRERIEALQEENAELKSRIASLEK